jgi:hypothetical protein
VRPTLGADRGDDESDRLIRENGGQCRDPLCGRAVCRYPDVCAIPRGRSAAHRAHRGAAGQTDRELGILSSIDSSLCGLASWRTGGVAIDLRRRPI